MPIDLFEDAPEKSTDKSGWMSIASAPRDGSKMLLYMDSKSDLIRMSVGYWNSHPRMNCWMMGGIAQKVSAPTHWMPLPDVPEEAK